MRVIAAGLSAFMVLGCAVVPSEPTLFAGTLEDAVGMPVAGATVVIEAHEQADVPAGVEPPVAFHAETTTSPSGTFEFRQAPNEELRQLAILNRGPLSFTATARVPERNLEWSFNFVREMGRESWADTITPIRWRPVP